MTPTDRQIAELVLADPEKAVISTVSDLKEASGVSSGSIIGFCRRMGLNGYADFKMALARDLSNYAESNASSDQQEVQSLSAVISNHQEALRQTTRMNSSEVFDEAVDQVCNAQRVTFFAEGYSTLVAELGANQFSMLGLLTSAHSDSAMQLMDAAHITGDDLAIGLSCDGNTPNTLRCLKLAREKGAATVCITNTMKSPMTEIARVSLYTAHGEHYYFKTQLTPWVTQLAIIDALCVAVANKYRDRAVKNLELLRDALDT
jgi:DNA-binding MurR/RpiR family transcriptional regulator